jgi:cardiolipin synthase
MRWNQLPNTITLARLFMVPALILVLKDEDYRLALLIFLVAGISDALDGYIAKKYNFVTQFGAVLDPVADKLLLVSAYIMLSIIGHVPFWLVLAVVSRDLFIVGGYMVVTSLMGAVTMNPSLLSKLNTLMQIILVIAILADQAAGQSHYQSHQLVLTGLIYIVLLTTIASGIHYFWLWIVKKEILTVEERSVDLEREKGKEK